MSIVDFSASIAVAESARQVFQEILDNLLAFNESSPTIFVEAETYLVAASTGLSQAAQSWDASTQTYLPPRRDADLSWKGTINTGWTKRQERIEETKSQQSFVKYIDELSFSEMEERYGKLISEYESYLNTGYNFPQRADLTAEQINYIYSRYQYLRAGGGAIYIESESSKKMKANLLASDKEEVDGMSLVELADKYPEFLRGRISIEFDYIFMSDEEKAKKDYSYVRFNQLMNAEPIDWRDPDYAAKRNKYILETGKNPSTNEPATEAEIITAKNYGWVKAIPDTVAWTDMMVGSYVGHQVYNGKPVYGIDTNFAGELRNPIVSSQTVFGPQLPSKNWTLELPKVETKTIMGSQSMVSEINPGGNTDAPAINTGGVEVSNNLKFNLNDIDSFDNANIKSVEAFLDNELQGYRKAPLKRGDGVRYYDGKGNSWQLNYGYENATDNIHGKPYLKTTYNGEIVRIPLQK